MAFWLKYLILIIEAAIIYNRMVITYLNISYLFLFGLFFHLISCVNDNYGKDEISCRLIYMNERPKMVKADHDRRMDAYQ